MTVIQRLIPFRLAVNGLLILNSLVVVFHLLVLTQVIPFPSVWGGRLQNVREMVVFESLSIGINIFLVIIVLIRAGTLSVRLPQRLVSFILWVFTGLFLLNTLGNLVAVTTLETVIATPLTLLASILCFRLAIQK